MPARSVFLKSATKFLCPCVSIYWGLLSDVYDNSIPDSYIQELWAFRLLKKQKTFFCLRNWQIIWKILSNKTFWVKKKN